MLREVSDMTGLRQFKHSLEVAQSVLSAEIKDSSNGTSAINLGWAVLQSNNVKHLELALEVNEILVK